jgi:lipopolysaccharide export system permease protein
VKVLDRYVVMQFVKGFLGSLLLFTITAIILDFLSRLHYFANEEKLAGTFAEGYSSFKLVLYFYAAYLPFVLKEIIPFVTVASALFVVTTMLRDNEVFPVVAAGVSARRLFLPLFFCGAAVCAGHLAFQEYAVPALGREQVALKRFFAGDRSVEIVNMPHLRDTKGTVTRVRAFSFADRSLHDVVVQRPWTEAGFERWMAPVLMPAGDAWTAPDGVLIEPAGVAAVPRRLPPGSPVDIGVTPAEVEALASKTGTADLSYSQLSRLAAKFPDRRHLAVALHKQIARPLTSIVLLLCSVPVLLAAGRSVFRGGALAFGISASYYLLDVFFTSIGARGDLAPVFAAYFPLVLLASFGISRLVVVPT